MSAVLIVFSISNLYSQNSIDSDDDISINEGEIDSGDASDSTTFAEDIESDSEMIELEDIELESDLELVDAELSTELEVQSFDTVELESEIDFSSEINIEVDAGSNNLEGIEDVTAKLNFLKEDILSYENRTPTSLLFSLYLLWFGGIGVAFYDIFSNKAIWMSVTLITPFFCAKILAWIWRKIATNTTYRVPIGFDLIGVPATVKIPVSSEGGTISIRHSDTTQQFVAKSLSPLSWFYPGDVVYICDYKKGIYYVDEFAENIKNVPAKKNQKLGNKKFSYIFSKSVNANR